MFEDGAPEPQVPAELELSPGLCAQLGLREGEALRLLASAGRALVLERSSEGDVRLPLHRDLVLTSDVRAFSLADILHLIHGAAKSGFLHFQHSDCVKTVFLHGGEVVFATSNQRVDRLGECLVRSGVIDAKQQRAADAVYQLPSPYGRTLVELGFLTPRELWDGVKGQVEEIVRSLFAFGAGTVLFWEGEVRPDNVVRLALPTQRLIEEGLEQRDELLEFLAYLEDPRVRLEPVAGAAERLGGGERAILEALEEQGAFAAVCRRVGLDPLSGARTVRLLDAMGALRIARGAEPVAEAEAEGGAEEAALRSCVRAHARLLEELAAPIVAMEGVEGIRARLAEVAQEASSRHPELLAALDVGPGGTLDPRALIARALRFPGDREREVRAALGELVSYLEFELLNHPKIEDADLFLDGLDELRAQL
jgi:Domain of unknown function (DUF4388)